MAKGRHALPASERRSLRLTCRATVREVDEAYKAAYRQQVPLSELLRAGLAHAIRRPPRPRE